MPDVQRDENPSEFLTPEYLFKPPEGFVYPPLDPSGVELKAVELGRGVFGLISEAVSVNNSGFIVGDDAVLVIDSGINGQMARQIQDAVKRHTPLPIRFLVNTNQHGDHWFGNYAFPADVRIVAHRVAAQNMQDLEREKLYLRGTVGRKHSEVFAEIELRTPDIQFDNSLHLDLGGRTVEVHHFGYGNTPGDAVVYEPSARVAWTGNMAPGQGMVPLALHGRAVDYLTTTARFAATLAVETIICGHGRPTTGRALGRDMRYLADMLRSVRLARLSGRSLEQTLSEITLDDEYVAATINPLQAKLVNGFHRFNVQQTYLDLAAAEEAERAQAA